MNCENCGKPESLCVCASVVPKANRHAVLFFQHPQEPDKELGSALLAHRALENSVLKIGLSVSNLKKALGREDAVPAKWGVLYLGSGIKGLAERPGGFIKPGLYPVKKDGELLPEKETAEVLASLEGVILLDGTWSQAKTLWWRNSWLLKCRRLVLVPRTKSLYGELRKEPRRECLSTIETTADTLDALGEDPAISTHLRALFAELLAKYRASRPARKPVDRRRRR
ncbi:MAG: DTW domain-containing protein [Bdellovibrionales bacterium]|nr:DTW domain-containing protein [Bdellovibrionales bacterium]